MELKDFHKTWTTTTAQLTSPMHVTEAARHANTIRTTDVA